ncbi:porin [Halomonas salipaludis]|uniref:Porin n=1 Tax=Halomonas salipaludis TaxID=2032625 RepID=A0A2A2EW88_9GAMM|nr:porin [Halomonas salipaludis]PAU76649.1 porin [Halomonas salipaludis]
MKKTLLATAIAGALGVSAAAQAATVYSQDGTEVDVYGRIVYGLTTGGQETGGVKENGSELEDLGSRLGFRARHEVNSDLSVFARMEFRFDASQRNEDAFSNTRSTYLGLQSQQFGRVMVGNFNSMYYDHVGVVFDVPENLGWESLGGTSNSSFGNSIAYSTPVLEGFQAHVQAKHYTGNDQVQGTDQTDSTTSMQAVVNYTWQDLYVAAGYDQNKDFGERNRGEGFSSFGESANSDEAIWGMVASYQFTPQFSGRIGYETTSTNDEEFANTGNAQYIGSDIASIGATFDYGMGEIYGQYARVSFDDNDDTGNIDSSNRWMLGANYRFSQPMYVFAEVYDSDFDTDQTISDANDDLLYTLGVRYDF